ncbi:unnamed protein product, partial [Tuber aestivum]
VIPYRRNNKFTGRENLIESVKRLAHRDGHNRIALHGLGGSGKTQIALEYVFQRGSESDCHVFWVQGSGISKFSDGFRAIAQHVGIPRASGETDEENLLWSVKRWFEYPDSGNWILVIDNADNEEDFVGNSGPIAKFVPEGPGGTLIFTTRSRQIAVEQECERINVGKMEKEEAQVLFSKHFGSWRRLKDGEEEVVAAILGSVYHLPLAVVGSAAFMVQTETTPFRYWTIFQENDKRMKKLLLQKFSDARQEAKTQKSILGTYFITFRRIAEWVPAAWHLLRLISFFDRQNIPERLLRDCSVEGMDDSIEFRLAIGKLLGFSLVTAVERGDKIFYELHRLVQLSVQAYLSEELDKWSTAALGVIYRVFPEYDHELRDLCEEYLPHALAVTKDHPDSLTCAGKLAFVLQRQGKYDESAELNLSVLSGCEKILGPAHPHTLTTANNLAILRGYQGKYDESEALHRHALEGLKKVCGPNHPETLTNLNNLAIALQYQGKYDESEMISRRALEGRQNILGPEHPDTLTSINSLAIVLECKGKYDESEKLNRHALEVRERVLGKDHPDTLTSVNNLAIPLQFKENYNESERMTRRALEGRERIWGRDHPDTLASLNNLAIVLQYQRNYGESEKINRGTLEGREKILGRHHPDTLTSLNNLAIVLDLQGKYNESEIMNRRALERRGEILGSDHQDTLATLNNLAFVLRYQGKYDESEMMNRQVLERRKETLGPDHLDTLTSANNLAVVLDYQG